MRGYELSLGSIAPRDRRRSTATIGGGLLVAFAFGLAAGLAFPRAPAASGQAHPSLAQVSETAAARIPTMGATSPTMSVGDIIAANEALWLADRPSTLSVGDIIAANDAAWMANRPPR